jgi:hypothetical protein
MTLIGLLSPWLNLISLIFTITDFEWLTVTIFRYMLQRNWFRHYATSRKFALSNPDKDIDFFSLFPNSSSRNMALEFTQPVTEMSTRNLPGGKGGALPARKADNFTVIGVSIV